MQGRVRGNKLRNYRQQEDVSLEFRENSFTAPSGFIRAVSDRSNEASARRRRQIKDTKIKRAIPSREARKFFFAPADISSHSNSRCTCRAQNSRIVRVSRRVRKPRLLILLSFEKRAQLSTKLFTKKQEPSYALRSGKCLSESRISNFTILSPFSSQRNK